MPLTRADLDITDEARVRAAVAVRAGGAGLRAATAALLRAAPAHGLYHCVGSGHATWFEVATALAGELGVEPTIRGVTLDELNLRAPRPRFCALSNRKLAAAGERARRRPKEKPEQANLLRLHEDAIRRTSGAASSSAAAARAGDGDRPPPDQHTGPACRTAATQAPAPPAWAWPS